MANALSRYAFAPQDYSSAARAGSDAARVAISGLGQLQRANYSNALLQQRRYENDQQQRQNALRAKRNQEIDNLNRMKILSQIAERERKAAEANRTQSLASAADQYFTGLQGTGAYDTTVDPGVYAEIMRNAPNPVAQRRVIDEIGSRLAQPQKPQVINGIPYRETANGYERVPGTPDPQPKTPLVTVNTGDKLGGIPKGYQLHQGDDGGYSMAAIPGSPDAVKAQKLKDKAAGRKKQTARAGGTVIQDLQRAFNIIDKNWSASGAPAIVTQYIPESEAQAAKGMIESALSNVGLDTLQQMRENSPTGGALGQVPIQQQKRLEQVLGSLDVTQRKDILKDNLNRVINIYTDIVYGTPAEIQYLIEQGEINPTLGKKLMQRKKLSFDEFGNPVNHSGGEGGIKFLGFE